MSASCLAFLAVAGLGLSGPGGTAGLEPPPLRFADIELKTGVRLHYAEQGDETGRPLILLHGYSDSWFSYSRVLPLLGPEHHVFALDLRGHGDSDRPATGYAMGDLARDVGASMEARGLTDVTVVGHSMGSFVAQQVALQAPERVARLVLIGTATSARNVIGIHDLEAVVLGLTDPVPVEFVREFQVSTIHVPLPDVFVDRVVAESSKLPARVWQALLEGMLATPRPAGLEGNPVPALILWGENDAMMSRDEQDALARMLPNAVIEAYADTGHALHWERPEAFARDLQAFLSPMGSAGPGRIDLNPSPR